ncbi:type-F conjugative transfer system protein TraW [Candidatus Tisiphia endosymbiont of Hybos culiciformis]|uniref:type-F conjugative transfer system protein TraW n=1 Tax=Candidatus Tisiphia endosymbiont of Hybos culiciformis TaxID=3139331 RepID=UPI003CCA9843
MKQLIIALVILLPQITIAKDFGIYGTIFEVKEEGFLAMIQRKLKLVDIEQEQRKMLEIAKNRIEEPVLVTNIKRTEKPQSFTYEPSYMVKEDIVLPNGKLLYALGTRVNPLDHMSLDKKLIFINGKDSLQIEWFKQQQSNGVIKEEDKLILIAGRPLDLQKELNREVYFDQAGILTTKFNIEQVPAIIEQEGKLLRIREVEID